MWFGIAPAAGACGGRLAAIGVINALGRPDTNRQKRPLILTNC